METAEKERISEELNSFACRIAKQLTGPLDAKIGKVWFTGLKDKGYSGTQDKELPMFEFVGQWIDYRHIETGEGYYVNIPGLEHGLFYRGGSFDIGQDRITLFTDNAEIERLVREGYALLLEKADEYWKNKLSTVGASRNG